MKKVIVSFVCDSNVFQLFITTISFLLLLLLFGSEPSEGRGDELNPQHEDWGQL